MQESLRPLRNEKKKKTRCYSSNRLHVRGRGGSGRREPREAEQGLAGIQERRGVSRNAAASRRCRAETQRSWRLSPHTLLLCCPSVMGGFGKGGELSAAQLEALDATTLALSVPSALAALAIIASYWRYSELRSHAFSLVHWLAVADLLNALWPFVPRDPAAACSFQAFINQTFSLASILWTAAIAHTLYATVVQRAQRVEKYMRSYHIAIWALSLLSAVVPLAAGRFASVGPWCWIATAPSGDKGGAAMRFAVSSRRQARAKRGRTARSPLRTCRAQILTICPSKVLLRAAVACDSVPDLRVLCGGPHAASAVSNEGRC